MKYVHTNIVSKDWRSLSAFYINVFNCSVVPPERNQSGAWLAKGTGTPKAALQGVHLRLPGYNENGPTLEIYTYKTLVECPPGNADQQGFRHIAFEVENVAEIVELSLIHGGRMAGEIVKRTIEDIGTITFVYIRDPEGNLIELQHWDKLCRGIFSSQTLLNSSNIMRQIKIYTAISLNGMIAKKDGDIHWLESLPNPDNTDYGYSSFISTIDTTIQGYNTYKVVLDKGVANPTVHLDNYVFTNKQDPPSNPHIKFITHNHLSFSQDLIKRKGKDIWLIGGGQLNTFFLNHQLVDELYIFVMPIIIENGIKLFEHHPIDQHLKLVNTKVYQSGVVLLKYQLN